MAKKIMNGFPLHPCSWLYAPIAPPSLTRVMIRWLDSVCVMGVGRRLGTGRIAGTRDPRAASNNGT